MCLEDRQLQCEETMFPAALNCCTHHPFTGNLLPARDSSPTLLRPHTVKPQPSPSPLRCDSLLAEQWLLRTTAPTVGSRGSPSSPASTAKLQHPEDLQEAQASSSNFCARKSWTAALCRGDQRNETNNIGKTFLMTRTFCRRSPWHTTISTRFLPSPLAP